MSGIEEGARVRVTFDATVVDIRDNRGTVQVIADFADPAAASTSTFSMLVAAEWCEVTAPPPIPDDAIGMCPEGHVMLRGSTSFDGWWHKGGTPCSYADDPFRTVEVVGTRSRP